MYVIDHLKIRDFDVRSAALARSRWSLPGSNQPTEHHQTTSAGHALAPLFHWQSLGLVRSCTCGLDSAYSRGAYVDSAGGHRESRMPPTPDAPCCCCAAAAAAAAAATGSYYDQYHYYCHYTALAPLVPIN
jgi:hypothetical protein